MAIRLNIWRAWLTSEGLLPVNPMTKLERPRRASPFFVKSKNSYKTSIILICGIFL